MSSRVVVADAVVASIVYSIHLILAITLLYKIYTYKHRPHRYKHMALVSTLLILGTIEVSAYLYFNLAGGLQRLLDFFQVQFSLAGESALAARDAKSGLASSGDMELRRTDILVQYVNGLAALAINWVANGYMLYRCFVIWSHSSARCVVVLPFLLYLAIIGNGIFGTYNLSQPNNALGTKIFTRLHWAFSLSSNALISLLIVARLLLIRRRAMKAFGNSKERREAYTGCIAVLVESSLLYTLVVSIAYPLYGPTAPVFKHTGATENMVNPLLVQTECIAAGIIVLRFVRGRAWTSNSAREVQDNNRLAGDVEHRLSAPAFAVNPNLNTSSTIDYSSGSGSSSGVIELGLMSSKHGVSKKSTELDIVAEVEELALGHPKGGEEGRRGRDGSRSVEHAVVLELRDVPDDGGIERSKP
ncbi:hypothetical protein BDV98DRAFT_584874 [Pterulicium gracile]|uniref:Uncharacterized protein n=1 Tax=Pterulicium gracile TaxID=1884261 RepID=A0A5C3Q8T6_9AGAR|nr:hypothetical protein BDV98DRAFT_584874 [Pterula gracilis]